MNDLITYEHCNLMNASWSVTLMFWGIYFAARPSGYESYFQVNPVPIAGTSEYRADFVLTRPISRLNAKTVAVAFRVRFFCTPLHILFWNINLFK